MAWTGLDLNYSVTFFRLLFFVRFTIFFSCCKVHDFCEEALLKDADKCNVNRGTFFITKDFKYNKATNKCCEYNSFTFFACLKTFVPFFFLLEALQRD